MSRNIPPTPARIWITVVATPVRNGTPRHSMFGRAAAGSASIANGISPSVRKTIALSGTKAIIHAGEGDGGANHIPAEDRPEHVAAPLQRAPAVGEQLNDREQDHARGDVEIVEQN